MFVRKKKRTTREIDMALDAAITIRTLGSAKISEIADGIRAFSDEIAVAAKTVNSGDLSHLEEMLYTQAVTLDSVFHRYVRLAACAMETSDLSTTQTFSLLAIKAQNASRATLGTLANIKNPRKAIFLKQENHANNQQINNSLPEQILENFKPNELLRKQDDATLDTRGTIAPVRVNTYVETLEEGWGEDS